MEIGNIFKLQDQASLANIRLFPTRFHWCHHSVELMVDTHVFLANNADVLAYRKGMKKSDLDKFEAMNIVVNLDYDATGSLISSLRLLEYGILADAWCLIRSAFESTCYAEFFMFDDTKAKAYTQIGNTIKQNSNADIRREIEKVGLGVKKVIQFLEARDGQNRAGFYGRLCNFGTHASPVRSGLRIKANELEVRAYLSIGHRDLIQCLEDFAAVAKYTLGIPFDAWPSLIQKNPSLIERYKYILNEYKATYEPT